MRQRICGLVLSLLWGMARGWWGMETARGWRGLGTGWGRARGGVLDCFGSRWRGWRVGFFAATDDEEDAKGYEGEDGNSPDDAADDGSNGGGGTGGGRGRLTGRGAAGVGWGGG
ncbi:hypothetical protein B0T18DRAFT_219179 [Schizothecium vesticola]|uniref:Uncharacterized protein n=1 Tax=Schizothecium vesticola TaxID=314040 RepID=A0AA40EK92_9PEZI|nr:hypothetical protein B0T18DRAFT_219179 [Schizothecium vesticola]